MPLKKNVQGFFCKILIIFKDELLELSNMSVIKPGRVLEF